jgi:NAD-dependent SIR2 family protein deacetylase
MELEDRITYKRGKNHTVECSHCGWPNKFNEAEWMKNKKCKRCGQVFSLDPEKARKKNQHLIMWTGVLPCNATDAHPNKVIDLPAEVWSDGYDRSLRDHREPRPCQVEGCDGVVRIPKDLPRGVTKDWDGK